MNIRTTTEYSHGLFSFHRGKVRTFVIEKLKNHFTFLRWDWKWDIGGEGDIVYVKYKASENDTMTETLFKRDVQRIQKKAEEFLNTAYDLSLWESIEEDETG